MGLTGSCTSSNDMACGAPVMVTVCFAIDQYGPWKA